MTDPDTRFYRDRIFYRIQKYILIFIPAMNRGKLADRKSKGETVN